MKTAAASRAAAPITFALEASPLRRLRHGSLLATLLVGAMIPWYTLHLFPAITVGAAKVNLLDVLAACAVLVAIPTIVRRLLGGPRTVLWVAAFIAYMLIPLIAGLRDPHARFLAVRESRALAFYLLALVFASGGYQPRDFRAFAAAYVIGTVAAIAAVFAHLLGFIALPGYPPQAVAGRAYTWWSVRYLEWTVMVTAFLLSLATAMTTSSRPARLWWGAASAAIAWYVLATSERFLQFLAVATGMVVISLPVFGGLRPRRLAIIGAALAVAALIGIGAAGGYGPSWFTVPVKSSVYRWVRAGADNSVQDRLAELREVGRRLAPNPLFGEGLGGLVLRRAPHDPGHPWPYASSGYVFLLIKTGILGLGLYLGMVWTAVVAGRRAIRARTVAVGWPAPVIGMVGLGLLLTLNVLYPTVDTPEGAIAFSLFYGMLVSPEPA